MKDDRVGRDISASERWREGGAAYAEAMEGPYHRHRLAVVNDILPQLAGRTVVDVGCGEGVLIREARRRGAARVIGIDIDPGLLARAEASGAQQLVLGGVEQLAEVDRADCVLAINVAAYFTAGEDERFYREVARLLQPGGSLVITHSNELFDLFTLNRFTVDFFDAHFGCDVAGLLTHPAEPDRLSFNIRENPLAYPQKLARYGLVPERVEFVGHHETPPLLCGPVDGDDIDAREYADTLAVPDDERWKLMFQCSMFAVRATKR